MAELLIAAAIISVLVGVSIPIFSAQLKKARLATNQANARSAYAAAAAEILTHLDELDDTYVDWPWHSGQGRICGCTV